MTTGPVANDVSGAVNQSFNFSVTGSKATTALPYPAPGPTAAYTVPSVPKAKSPTGLPPPVFQVSTDWSARFMDQTPFAAPPQSLLVEVKTTSLTSARSESRALAGTNGTG